MVFGKISITILIDILQINSIFHFIYVVFYAFIFKTVINPMIQISIQLLGYTWWKKDSKLWTISLVITHDNTSDATIIMNNLFNNDGLEKAACAPVWSVHNPLWHFIVHIIYTLKSPVACRHYKHVQHVCIHTQVDNYPDWPSHCFHSFNCSMIIPWRKYFWLHNSVDKYFDDLDDRKCSFYPELRIFSSPFSFWPALTNSSVSIACYTAHDVLSLK